VISGHSQQALAAPQSRFRGGLNFYLVDQLLEARNHHARAGLLLRVPDALLLTKADVMAEACTKADFPLGADYIAVRVSAMSAVRQVNGDMPQGVVQQLDYWRSAFCAIAGGAREQL